MIILSASPLQGTKLLIEFKSTLKGENFTYSDFKTYFNDFSLHKAFSCVAEILSLFEIKSESSGVRVANTEKACSSSEDSSDDEVDSNVLDQPCIVCSSLEGAEKCLVCDKSNLAIHYCCIGLSCVPSGDWCCPWCVKKTKPSIKEVKFLRNFNGLCLHLSSFQKNEFQHKL
jgi:hypothetical protein